MLQQWIRVGNLIAITRGIAARSLAGDVALPLAGRQIVIERA